MRTSNSIRLEETRQPCCHFSAAVECSAMTTADERCGSYRCPFYKPEGCRDWVRIEDNDGINLMPPEEYYTAKRRVLSWG